MSHGQRGLASRKPNWSKWPDDSHGRSNAVLLNVG